MARIQSVPECLDHIDNNLLELIDNIIYFFVKFKAENLTASRTAFKQKPVGRDEHRQLQVNICIFYQQLCIIFEKILRDFYFFICVVVGKIRGDWFFCWKAVTVLYAVGYPVDSVNHTDLLPVSKTEFELLQGIAG